MTPVISDTDLINIKEVERSVGLKKSSIYERISNNEFPKPKKLGAEPPAGYAARSKSGKNSFFKSNAAGQYNPHTTASFPDALPYTGHGYKPREYCSYPRERSGVQPSQS
jgi:prophage regulatory protein